MSNLSKGLLFLVNFLCLTVAAQEPLLFSDSLSRVSIGVRFAAFAESNALDYRLLNASYWDASLKEKQIDRFNGSVRLGFGQSFQLDWRGNADSSDPVRNILAYELYNGIGADDDLARIILLGNTPFKGQDLSISNSGYRRMSLASYFRESSSSKEDRFFQNMRFGYGIFLGESISSVDIGEGNLLTDSLNRFIESTSAFQVWSPSSQLISGVGIGLGIRAERRTENYRWMIEVPRIGLIGWFGTNGRQNRQNPSRFDGFDVQDINNIEGDWTDSLEQDFLESPVGFPLMLNPFQVRTALLVPWQERNTIELEASYLFLPGAIPNMRVSLGTAWKDHLLSVGASYGGFAGLRSSLSALLFSGRKLSVHVQAAGVESLILPDIPMTSQVQLGVFRNL